MNPIAIPDSPFSKALGQNVSWKYVFCSIGLSGLTPGYRCRLPHCAAWANGYCPHLCYRQCIRRCSGKRHSRCIMGLHDSRSREHQWKAQDKAWIASGPCAIPRHPRFVSSILISSEYIQQLYSDNPLVCFHLLLRRPARPGKRLCYFY